jgi:hypothetical protein
LSETAPQGFIDLLNRIFTDETVDKAIVDEALELGTDLMMIEAACQKIDEGNNSDMINWKIMVGRVLFQEDDVN